MFSNKLIRIGIVVACAGLIAGLWMVKNLEWGKSAMSSGMKSNQKLTMRTEPVASGRTLSNMFKVASGSSAGRKVTVYDGTIEKYNGYYYLMGTGSMGTVYRSADMIHWESPYRLISNARNTLPPYADEEYPRFGASDLFFHNGVMFYGFNGNNLLHGNPATMQTVPDFRHSFWDGPYDDGIDLQFYVAHNGDLLYIRKVNPNEPDPNTGAPKPNRSGAWLWQVESFFNEQGHPGRSQAVELLHSQPGHWSNLNHVNFEGPELYYHNGQYYLLYASNQMFPETGLYDTGAAQASRYDQFDNSAKYPGKLLSRNIERLLLKYNVILPTAEHGSQPYAYTFTKPEDGWREAEFDASGWSSGAGGFGWPLEMRTARIPGVYNGGANAQSGIWGAPAGPGTIWARRSFTLDRVPDTVVLRQRIEGYGALYVNGQELLRFNGQQRAYRMIEVPADMLQAGTNVIAVEVNRQGPRILDNYHVDFGLYDTNGWPVEADIVGPSQPNIIKGPNGFETWIVYKAFWNSDNGQGKDRIYFWGQEMAADGPTSPNSPGLRFDAWRPSFQDRFDGPESLAHYSGAQGDVSIQDQALQFNARDGLAEILLEHFELANYFLETNILFGDPENGKQGQAGVTVWYKDARNYVRLLIDRDHLTYTVSVMLDGRLEETVRDLPSTFRFRHEDERASEFPEQYQPLRVYKNGSKLFAELAHYKLNNDEPVLELDAMAGPGRPGLVCLEAECRMDNVALTAGWSEYGRYFNGWSGSWSVGDGGLKSPGEGEHIAVKGDRLLDYEFSVQIEADKLPRDGKAGVILAYVDEDNYVAGYTDYAGKQFEVRQVVNGEERVLGQAPAVRDTIYGHENVEGNVQSRYEYQLRGTAEISQARILWTHGGFGYLRTFFELPEAESDRLRFESWNEESSEWDILGMEYEDRGKGDYHVADFAAPVVAGKLQLHVPQDNNRPFSLAFREEISSHNFYKAVRLDGQLYVWVNHELIFALDDPFENQPAQFGLYTDRVEAAYNAFTGFEIK